MNRKKKNLINITIYTLVAILLVAAINIFVTVISGKLNLSVDLTENKLYGLSDKTKSFLKDYNTDVDIYILSGAAQQDQRVSEITKQYQSLCPKIRVTNINTAENPTFGAKYVKDGGSITTNSVIVDSGKRYKLLSPTDLTDDSSSALNAENSITAALKYVAAETTPKIYLTAGHGEHEAVGIIKRLEEENYEYAELNTLTEEIPKDASAVISLRPMSDFTSEEITKIDTYLTNGGNLQVYLGIDSKQENMQNFFAYLDGNWGMTVTNDLAVETDESSTISGGNGTPSLIIARMMPLPFTDSIIAANRAIAHTPFARVVTPKYEYNGDIQTVPVLTTTDKAYPSSDETTLAPNDGTETKSYPIAALATDSKHNSSVYVSGTTMLLTIDPSRVQGLVNYDYFMNLTEYTTGEGSEFYTDAKPILGSRIYISESAARIVMIIVVGLIPVVVLLCGIVVWFKRRNL